MARGSFWQYVYFWKPRMFHFFRKKQQFCGIRVVCLTNEKHCAAHYRNVPDKLIQYGASVQREVGATIQSSPVRSPVHASFTSNKFLTVSICPEEFQFFRVDSIAVRNCFIRRRFRPSITLAHPFDRPAQFFWTLFDRRKLESNTAVGKQYEVHQPKPVPYLLYIRCP